MKTKLRPRGKPFSRGTDDRRNLAIGTANLNPYVSGPSHPLWRGGVSEQYSEVHNQHGIIDWAGYVRQRDQYTCRRCGAKRSRMAAHHIKSILDYPELALDVENGITLCPNCHTIVHWEESRRRNMPEVNAFCMRCKEKRDMKEPEQIEMKNGRPATQGTCPVCGTKMFKIGKS